MQFFKKNIFSKNQGMNTQGYIKLEFDVLGVAKKLVKYAVHLYKRKTKESEGKKCFSSHMVPKQQRTNFLS
jgi:hypothetical protein